MRYQSPIRILLTGLFCLFCFVLCIPIAFAHSSITSVQSGKWSDPSTWDGGEVPGYHDSVTIATGTTVTYDSVAEEMIHMLMVEGKLRFSTTTDTKLIADEIMVTGTWEMGIAQDPIPSLITAEVQLTGDTKKIEVEDGDFLVFGDPHAVTWTHLDKTAQKQSKTITLKKAVDWKVADTIVIAPTGYRAKEAEQRTITAVSANKRVLTLNAPLRYTHLGENYEFAEVGLLSHNIQFRGEDVKRAGHVMFMGKSTIQIRSAHFDQLGYYGVVAKYPLHFHMMGDGDGSFITQTSITNSQNRCITVHATNNVLIKDNVAYNTKGHCYFLEDGVEEHNRFIHNLGVYTKKGATLSSDRKPATFWITNPNNTFKQNSAAGSDSFGFWFHLLDTATGFSEDSTIVPSERPLKEFAGNIAHSNAVNGVTIDGHGFSSVSYEPKKKPIFRSITAYKNRNAGIWMRGEGLTVKKSTLVNNRVGLIFAGKNNRLHSSLVIGQQGEDAVQKQMPYIHGVEFYDGPMHVTNTHFKNFQSREKQIQAALSTKPANVFAMSPENSFTNITFTNAQKLYINDVERNGELFTVITNKDKNATIVPLKKFHKSKGCKKKKTWNVYRCPYIDYGKLTITDPNTSKRLTITRNDTDARVKMKAEGAAQSGRFIMNVPMKKKYRISLKNKDGLKIEFEEAEKPITLRLKYKKEPEKILRNGTPFSDWTYNTKKHLVILKVQPDKKYVILK